MYALLSIVGLVLLVRRGASGAVVALPLVVTVAAAMARQYPFRDRLILFLLPCLFIGFGCAVSYIHRRLRRVRVELAVMVTALLMAGTLSPLIRVRPPYTMEDMKPIMAALTGAQGDHEAIYVHANAAAAVTYYAPRYGISPMSFTIGSCHFANGQALLHELDEFRGRPRLWVVLTHIIPPLAGERLDLLGYLDAIGHRRATITVPSRLALGTPLPAEAILYDLSDDERLHHMTAERFTVRGTRGTYLRTASRCAEGPISMVFGAGRSAP